MRSKYILLLILLTGSVSAMAQQDSVLTLRKCLDIAIKNNLTVQQTAITAERDRIGFVQAKENIIPSIYGQASRNFSTGRTVNPVTNTYINQSVTYDNYAVQGNVIIFNGLAYQNAIKQASLAYQSGKMAFQAAKDVVTVNVITNYLMVLDAQAILDQTKNQLAVAKQSADRGEVLENEGANKTASDIYDLRGSFQAANVNFVSAKNSLNSAMLSLFEVLNVPYNPFSTLEPLNADDLRGDKDITPGEVYAAALAGLADVKAATLMRQSAEKEVKYAKGLLLPQLNVGYGVTTNYSNSNPISYANQFSNNYGTYIGLGLNIPIFTNGIKRNAVSLAKLDLLNYRDIEENAKIMLKQSVEQAYYNMISAYNKYQALDAEAAAYSESFRISKIRFEAGVLTSVDFIISKDKMDAANLDLISARYNYFIYSKILDYYQGKLSF